MVSYDSLNRFATLDQTGGDNDFSNWYSDSNTDKILLGTSLTSGVIYTSAKQTLNTLSKSDAAYKTLKGIRTGTGLLSTSLSGISFGIYAYVAWNNPTWGNITQAGVNGVAFGLSVSPYTAWAGFGISALDSFGAFDSLYDDMNFNQNLYENTGMIIIPAIVPAMPGVNFIQLKR